MTDGHRRLPDRRSTGSAPALRPGAVARDARAVCAARRGASLLDIATLALPYLALSVVMYLLLDVSYLLVLLVAIPASGFLLRTFIVFHDCAHGSFFRTKRANAWLGATLGLMVFTPFASWRHSHAVHHARWATSIGAERATS